MALQKTLTLTNNFGTETVLPDCYIKVDSLSVTKESADASVFILSKPNGNMLTDRLVVFEVDLNGPNFIKQAYEHLKSLPEFEGAVDC